MPIGTFIDPTRHDGTCYRAASWTRIGMTAGRKSSRRRKPAQEILVLPLDPGFRDVLQGRPPTTRPSCAPAAPSPGPLRPDRNDPLVAMWLQIIDAATALAEAHDLRRSKRRRVLDSLIVMLFVFRLVLSRGGKGHATVVAELREQCRKPGIALPQSEPVAASSTCKARQRVHENLFPDLHREILRHGGDCPRWRGHRLFAIDGTRMHLPRKLVEAGCKIRNQGAHYPQGLVSCLYRLDDRVPVDFSLSAHVCERTAAMGHLHALEAGDVVVFDRGYFPFELLHAILPAGAHPVFRLQGNSADAFKAFIRRWSIGELFKVSRQAIVVDEFHGRTGRGIRQELHAHFNLIAMTRLLSGPGDALLAQIQEKDRERQTVNFRNAIAIVAANPEEMIFAHTEAIAGIVTRMAEGMIQVRSRLRPGRSCPRISMKPLDKWTRRHSLAS